MDTTILFGHLKEERTMYKLFNNKKPEVKFFVGYKPNFYFKIPKEWRY